MKRPKKFTVNPDSYLATGIDPLLDELEALRDAEPFPTLEEFQKIVVHSKTSREIYDYFKAFKTRTIEVMPEVWKEYNATTVDGRAISGELMGFLIGSDEAEYCKSIRPISTPTRESVLKRAKELGLTQAEIEVLGGEK